MAGLHCAGSSDTTHSRRLCFRSSTVRRHCSYCRLHVYLVEPSAADETARKRWSTRWPQRVLSNPAYRSSGKRRVLGTAQGPCRERPQGRPASCFAHGHGYFHLFGEWLHISGPRMWLIDFNSLSLSLVVLPSMILDLLSIGRTTLGSRRRFDLPSNLPPRLPKTIQPARLRSPQMTSVNGIKLLHWFLRSLRSLKFPNNHIFLLLPRKKGVRVWIGFQLLLTTSGR